MQRTRDMINNVLAKHTGQSLDKINTDTERDNFMSAEDAVSYGLIDKVIIRMEEKSEADG